MTDGQGADGMLGASGVPYFSQWESAELAERFVDGSLFLADDPRWPASRDALVPVTDFARFFARRGGIIRN